MQLLHFILDSGVCHFVVFITVYECIFHSRTFKSSVNNTYILKYVTPLNILDQYVSNDAVKCLTIQSI